MSTPFYSRITPSSTLLTTSHSLPSSISVAQLLTASLTAARPRQFVPVTKISFDAFSARRNVAPGSAFDADGVVKRAGAETEGAKRTTLRTR